MKPCSIKGCDKKHYALGYCMMHYKRFRRWGSPHFKARAANGEHKGCKVPGCTRKHKGNGYCEPHLDRLNRNGVLIDQSYGSLIIRTPRSSKNGSTRKAERSTWKSA